MSLREQWKLNALFFVGNITKAALLLHKQSQLQVQTQSSSFITLPKPPPLLALSDTSLFSGRGAWFAKSSTQVETMVAPQVVQPSSCELKLNPEPTGRPHPLGVRFSRRELAQVKDKARKAGCSTNEFIRASAFGSDYHAPRNPELVKALLALNRELTAQGSNINQIAKCLNGGKASPAEAEGMLGIIARTHIQTHRAIRAALSDGKEPQPWPPS